MGAYLDGLRTLVRQAVKQDGRGPFSRALGYRNSAKGIRRIEKFLAGDEHGEDLLRRLATVLRLAPDDVITKAAADLGADRKREIEVMVAKARAEFHPHLFVETERTIPSPIFVAVITGSPYRRFIPVASADMSPAEIGDIIRRHYEASKGAIIAFGKITGYRYQQTFDNGMKFDTDGRFIGLFEAPAESIPHMSLSCKGREIPSGVFRNCTT
ncbi:hypothetical protein KBA41_02155 [Candidatus Ozemobacteraceae bacterium]|nr:hypothetical protein [Candidatus Ozemobacteraceae bacterium]